MGMDKRLEQRFQQLERDNKLLRQEINVLRSSPTQNPVRRGVNSLLRMSTLGKIQNKRLYLPSKDISPVGPVRKNPLGIPGRK